MVVELKKTKVTKSIVMQSLGANDERYFNHFNYDILGWCLINGKRNERLILLYDRIKNSIITLPCTSKLSEGEITSRGEQRDDGKGGYIFPTVYRLYIYLPDLHKNKCILWSDDEKEVITKRDNLHKFLREVEQKGQIYL